MEGDHDDQVPAGGEPPMPISASDQQVGGGEPAPARLPWEVSDDEDSVVEIGSDIDALWSEDEDHVDPERERIMKNQVTRAGTAGLKYYNEMNEGSNFELDEPIFSKCFLFPGTLIVHAIFTAKSVNVIDGSSSAAGQYNPSDIRLFFAETESIYGEGYSVLCCVPIDFSRTDNGKGCVYCPWRLGGKLRFHHPPKGVCKFGESEKKDHERFEYDEWTSTSEEEE
ncbi:unnamed protein product, partial [Linum tenue]